MSTRLGELGQQLRETIPSNDIAMWGKAMVLIGLMYDEAVRMETAAYERGMEDGWRWGHCDLDRLTQRGD